MVDLSYLTHLPKMTSGQFAGWKIVLTVCDIFQQDDAMATDAIQIEMILNFTPIHKWMQ